MKKRPLHSRLFAAMLVVVMVISMIPANIFAVETATWTKVELADIQATDTIMVTMTNSSGVTYALPNAAATSAGPSAPVVTVDGTTITTDSSADYGWTVSPVTGGYTFSANGKYLYTINNNNGVRVSSTQGVWSLDGNYLKGSDGTNDRWLGVYDNNNGTAVASPNWRAYKNTTGNTKNQTVGFWKLGTVSGGGSTETTTTETTVAADKTVYTKADSIAAGDTVILFNASNGMLVSSTASGYKLAGVAATDDNGTIATDDTTVVWTVTEENGVYGFTQGDMKLGMVQSGSYVNLSTKVTDGNTGWNLSKGTAADTWYLKNTTIPASTYGDYYLEYYNGFTAYASSSPSDAAYGFVFYKAGPSVPTYGMVNSIAAGDTVVMYNANSGMLISSTASGYKLSGVAATVENNKIATEDTSVVWTVTEENGVYGFTQGDKKLGMVQSGSYVNLSTKATDGNTGWNLSKGTADSTWYLKNTTIPASTYGDYYLEYYNGFTAYASSSPSDAAYGFVFYKLGASGVQTPVEPENPIVPEGTVANLVTDVTTLSAGDEIILVCPSKTIVMGPSSGNYYASVSEGFALSADNKTAYFDEEKTQVIVLGEGATSGTWSLNAADVYMASVSGSSNYMKNESSLSAHSSWTIDIDTNGIATIKSTATDTERTWIRYNASSPRFSCYKSGQADVAIYKIAPKPSKITSADQFVSGTYAMVVKDGYAMGALDGSWVSVVQPTIEGDTVTDAKGGVWTLEVSGNSVKITDSNGTSIKPKGGNSNGISSGSYDWAWTFNESTQTFTFAGTGSDTVKLASNASEDATYGGFHRFRAYKNTTISGNPATYPCEFTLYAISEDSSDSTAPIAGNKVVIYNPSAKGVLASQNDTNSITNVLAEIEDNKAIPENGAVVFTIEENGEYFRFYNETYGYLCSNGTGNNAFYTTTASDDADWKLSDGKKGGYNMESRTAKFNGQYSQYLEYYADSYKTYSMYNVTDYDIYEFFFYPVADSVKLNGGIVNMPTVTFGTLTDAYVGADYSFSFTVDAVFGVDGELVVKSGNDVLTKNADGSYTIPADKISGTELVLTVSGKDTTGVEISGTAKVTVKDEPSIGEVTPAANTQTKDEKKPVISAEIINAGDNAQITMTINGEAVQAVIADGKITYTPAADMADGRVNVTVKVVRADQKETTKSWSFTIGEAKYQLYFGQLHSHTTYSDGSGSLASALDYIASLPDSANVDFVAFTDHSNYFDASGAANPEGALYDMSLATANSQKLWSEYTKAMDDFNASQSKVVALGGFEMTWSGGPGHINTFNTEGIVSRNNTTLNNKTNDAGMKAYYALLSQPEGADSISQFNHPGSTFGTFTDFAYWDALIDTRIQLVEVGNGEGQIGAGGYYPSYEYYTMALDKGWHVAPTNNQDNHKGKWGNANDARDVVLADELSEQGIYDAIRAMRMYSTEDKNLEIGYTVNDLMMGSSITEVPEKLNLVVTVYDPDISDSISKVEVIVNSGKVAHTWDSPSELATGELTVTLDPTYSYYYIRVTEGDGDLAVTSPVWVGESLKLGISSLECGTSTPVTGEEFVLTTTLFNSESTAATVKSITYTTNGGQVIGIDDNNGAGYVIPASGTVSAKYGITSDVAKVMTITATAVVDLNGEEFVFTMDIELDIQDSSKLVYIGIDASHYNEYVNGNYKDSMGNFGQLAAEYGVRTVTLNTSADLIAACANTKYKALILTAPSRRSAEAQAANPLKVYTDEELAAIKAFNTAGGTVILAGWSDHYENYPSVSSIANMKAEEHMAATQNAVLEALGSSLRIGDDATYDDTYNGGQAYRLYFNTYGDSFLTEGVEVDPENPHDRLYTEVFSHYGGASVYTADGTLPTTVQPVVFGHSGTYSVDVDQDGLGGTSMYKYAYAEGDNRLMIMATEQLEGQGLIIVSGAAFMSNFEVQATIEDSGSEKNYSNYKICENLLAMINPVTITPIAEVQAQTEVGYKYTIEGVVTSNASGYDKDTAFFDCIYVQDETGGVCCFPVAGNYKVGDVVRVTGTTEFYQGEMELQVTAIEKIGEGIVEPKPATAKEVSDGTVLGQLITVKGHVVSFEKANGLVQTIMVKDENGDTVRVFIDGYITTAEDVKNLKKGCEITVTGVASYDNTFNAPEGPFPRIRIRDRADIVCGKVPASNPDTGDNFNVVAMFGIMLVAMVGFAAVILVDKKRRYSK